MQWCCFYPIVLFIFAAVGHGIWLIGAAIVRSILNSPDAEPPPPRRPFRDCPACGVETFLRDVRCPSCDLNLNGKLAWQLSRVRTAQTETRKLQDSGELDASTARIVIDKLKQRARILRGLPPDPVPAGTSEVTRPAESAPTPISAVEPAPESITRGESEPKPTREPIPEEAVASLPVPTPSPEPIITPAPSPTSSPTPLEEPNRGSMIAAFMEERNILWGELVGGLLIVGCSIALVVTLWRSLETIPYFPFLLSAAITLALYGAGEYTLHHWKLTATSLGLLVIALLLTPLDLLLLSDPVISGKASLLIDVGVKLLAVCVFAWVVRGGGRDILTARPGWRWWLALAVVGSPATQLIPITWFPDLHVDLSSWLALGCFTLAAVVVLRDSTGLDGSAPESEYLESSVATALLSFVGLAAFGLAAAWGLHIAQSLDSAARIAGLALPLALAAVPIVEAGLLVQKKTREGGLRVVGTAVGLFGLIAITGALAAAWPDPLHVLLVSTAVGLFLTRIAFRESLAWAHAGAIPALALSLLVGYYELVLQSWNFESQEGLTRLFFPTPYSIHPELGVVLALIALLLALISQLLSPQKLQKHAISYAFGGAACGLIGLLFVNVNGLEYPLQAAQACAACGAALLAVNQCWQLRALAHGGLWLVLIGSLWQMQADYPSAYSLWGFLLSLEALAFAGLSLGFSSSAGRWIVLVRRSGRDLALGTVILACVVILAHIKNVASPWHTGTLFALALTCLALTRSFASPISTYFASGFTLLGLIHLNVLTLNWHPPLRAVQVALLSHATLIIAAAYLFRRTSFFALPFWWTSLISAGIAGILLFTIPASQALEWAGFAIWFGVICLVYSLKWQRFEAFSLFQIAVSVAAIYCSVAWIETQPWYLEGKIGFFNPVSLQVYFISLGLLGLAWATARHPLREYTTVRELWTNWPWSTERVVLATVVFLEFFVTIRALLPEVGAELAPAGITSVRMDQPEVVLTFGSIAWVAIGLLALAVTASWRLLEKDHFHPTPDLASSWDGSIATSHLVGLLLLFLTAPLIWAGTHATDNASATALRWGLGLGFVVGSALLAGRVPLRRWLENRGFLFQPTPNLRQTFLTILAISAGVVVAISIQIAQFGLSGTKLSGPILETPFAKMGALLSNVVPLALVVLGLAGTAVRERSSGYAFAGGIVFSSTIAAGYALGVVTSGGQIDASQEIRIWLLLSSSLSLWGIVWLSAEARVPGGLLLAIQSRLGFAGLLGIASIFPLVWLLIRPEQQLRPAWYEFGIYGWFTLALAAGSAFWQSMKNEPAFKFHTLTLTPVIAGIIAACVVQPWDTEGKWHSFHALAGTWVLVGIGLVAITRRTGLASLWLDGIAAALTIMAVRGGWSDPARPWATAGLSIVASAIIGTSGISSRNSIRVYASVFLGSLVALLVWLPSESNSISGFLLMNAAGLAVAAAVWSLIAMREAETPWYSVTDLARGIALVSLGFGVAPTLAGERIDPQWLTWGATGVVALAMGVTLWDVKAAIARGGLFAVGVAVVLLGQSGTTDKSVWIISQTPIALAGYCVVVAGVAALVARTRKGLLHLPERGDSWGWLLAAEGLIGAIVLVLGMRAGLLAPELAERISSPGSIVLLVGASLLLLRAMPLWADTLRDITVGLAVLTCATAAWAWPDPSGVAPWLERNAWLFVALAASGILASETGVRAIAANWRISTRSVGGISVAVSLLVLVANQIQQIPVYDPLAKRTPLVFAPVLAIMLAILGLIALLIRFALRAERDPLGLTEIGRTAYVYVAELLIVLFFVHLKLNVPELFGGLMVRYWTFTVMALAFVGVGLAEFFEGRSINVLAIPLRRTGVLLPLIPLLAFWAKPPAALTEFADGRAPGLSPFLAYLEKLPQHFDTYAWLWSLAGGVYALVALSRKSFGWALLAALAANASLWSMLTHEGIPFFIHPQAWVIPLALVVLISEHVNRHRLKAELSNGLRYLGISMIYIASSADMFIAGVGNSLWLPVVLAVFCVAGVLLGIMLRVRAFLYLGVGFLLLDIFSMIWHAAVNLEQTWVWYVSGIVLGVAILTLFAVFEKRKKRDAEG